MFCPHPALSSDWFDNASQTIYYSIVGGCLGDKKNDSVVEGPEEKENEYVEIYQALFACSTWCLGSP